MSRQEEMAAAVQSETIVDADFHLHVPASALFEYVEDDTIREKLESAGTPPAPKMGWSIGYATDIDFSTHVRPQGAAVDREEIRPEMEELGLDSVVVVAGTHLPFVGTRFHPVREALMRAYNDYVVDNVVDVENGIYASLVLPKRNPDHALAELDRLGDHPGFVGVQNWYAANRLWGDRKFDPIFERLVDLDLPLCLHIGATPRARYDLMEDSMQTYPEYMVTNAGHHVLGNVTNMVFNGVFERYPDLNVVLQEGGVNWIPYAAYRGDEIYQVGPEDVRFAERNYEDGREYLSKLPSEYIFENVWVTTQPIALPKRPDRARATLTAAHAPEMCLFATDWPHHTMDRPDWLFEGNVVDEDDRRCILRENARDVFRFPE